MRRLAGVIGLAALLGCPAAAPADNNVAAPFLQEGVGSRAVGMGENFAAVAEGPFGWYYNPAGLATAGSAGVGYQHENVANLVQHNVFAGSLPVGPGSMAVLLNFFNYGTFDEIDSFGQRTGNSVSPQEGSLHLGYGWALDSAWRVGAAFGYFSQNLGPAKVAGLVVDLGGKWDLAPDWSVAGVVKNLGGRPDGHPLPGTVQLAGSWRPAPEWLLLDLEFGLPLYDGFSDLGLGAEFSPWDWLDLRLGLKAPLTGKDAAAQNGVVLGMGFNLGGLSLDLALMGKGDVGSEVSLSLAYLFGGPAAAPAAQPRPQAEPQAERIATSSDQEQAEYHFRAGQEYERYNQTIDAIIEYKAALKLKPDYAQALKALAAAKDKAKARAEEDEAASEAAKRAGQPESMQKLISKYYREGEGAYQKKDYTTAIEKLQLVLEMTTQHRQATELLEKARAALTSEMAALRRQAQQAKERGDLAGELEAYEKMLDLRPEDKRAKADLEALKVRIPQEAERLYKTGVEFYAKRDYRNALSVFERLIKLQPDHAKGRDALNNTKEKLIQTGQ